MVPSSGGLAWIGDGEAPYGALSSLEDCIPGEVIAVLVDGNLDPSSASASVGQYCGPGIPWAVLHDGSDPVPWLDAGACAFIHPGTPPGTVLSTLEGLARLSEKATTRNPLSGLPGNAPIAARLRSHVIQGGFLAAYFDISGFKPFNDYYGFSRGDAVLRSLASILRENLAGHFVGHVGGDDFVAVGRGDEFLDSVREAVRIFNGRAGGFYSGRDHAAGGIEALDRTGEFRFYPVMDLTVSVVDGEGCETVDQLAMKAGLEKKRLKGEILPDTVAGFLDRDSGSPVYGHFTSWVKSCRPDTVQIKGLLETAGILGDTGMTECLREILDNEDDYRIRKSAARALGSIAGQDSAEILRKAMKDGNVHVRTAATMALPFVLGGEAGPLLKDAVEDENTWVRRAALRGLGVSGWSGAADLLAGALSASGSGKYWLNHRQELAAALEGASFLGDPSLSGSVAGLLHDKPGVRRSLLWKTLLTLGGAEAYGEMMNALQGGDRNQCIENLGSFDPSGLSRDESERLESVLVSLVLRRRSDRIQVLKMISRIQHSPSSAVSSWLLDRTAETEDPEEFESLLAALQARRIPPRGYDLARIVDRISGGSLVLSRKATVAMLRWASTGKYSISRNYLEKLLRHDSREVRTAAARAVLSLARRARQKNS